MWEGWNSPCGADILNGKRDARGSTIITVFQVRDKRLEEHTVQYTQAVFSRGDRFWVVPAWPVPVTTPWRVSELIDLLKCWSMRKPNEKPRACPCFQVHIYWHSWVKLGHLGERAEGTKRCSNTSLASSEAPTDRIPYLLAPWDHKLVVVPRPLCSTFPRLSTARASPNRSGFGQQTCEGPTPSLHFFLIFYLHSNFVIYRKVFFIPALFWTCAYK